MSNQTNRGFTLLELLITIAIAAIVLVLALPSYQDTIERNRLKEAVESVSADIKFARTEAIKQGANVIFSVDNATWCYGIAPGNTACDCTAAVGDSDFCTLKVVAGNQFQDIDLTGNNATFEFRRGTVTDLAATPNAIISSTLSSANYNARIDVNSVGLVSVCAPTDGLPAYPDCP